MLNAKITGIASYIPDDVLDNEMLSQMVDTNDEWITTRVGVKERRILKKPVGSSYMGIQAVNKLLEETGTDRNDIDLLICPTSNPDHRFPSTASIIAHATGIEKKAYAYDIQAACAGFLVARSPRPTKLSNSPAAFRASASERPAMRAGIIMFSTALNSGSR